MVVKIQNDLVFLADFGHYIPSKKLHDLMTLGLSAEYGTN